jgi:hypothetical protein
MRGGGMLWIRGNIRANADISEIEFYGYADKTDESVDELFK